MLPSCCKLLNVVRADSDLLASASSWSQPPTNNPPTCQCAPRPVKYVAIEIPKIIKVPAPAPPQMMMPPAPSQQTKQTIIPITIPLLTHVPAPAPAPMPAPAPSPPPSDGWSAQSNPWSN
uniref:Uncharacterized protein n=1 Tax=Tetranychus urticae TaxID=32264 RepID=T1K132_TETUR